MFWSWWRVNFRDFGCRTGANCLTLVNYRAIIYVMNAKELKKYDLIVKIGNSLPEEVGVVSMLGELAGIDFQAAVEMWEYMLTTYASDLARESVALSLESHVFATLNGKSEAKLRATLGEMGPLCKLIYTNCATAATGGNLGYLAGLILASKIEQAGEILKLVAANKNTNMDYGDRMKLIVDEVFSVYCAKNGAKVPSLNRKQTMLLLEFCLKIKGANKNLLVQRIKELG